MSDHPRKRAVTLPDLPRAWKRLYAVLWGVSAVCPACGFVCTSGFSRKLSIFTCPSCQKRWIVGALFWPLRHDRRPRVRKAPDQVLTRDEAIRLRQQSSGEVTPAAHAGRWKRRYDSQVNMACTCGTCPVHNVEDEDETPDQGGES